MFAELEGSCLRRMLFGLDSCCWAIIAQHLDQRDLVKVISTCKQAGAVVFPNIRTLWVSECVSECGPKLHRAIAAVIMQFQCSFMKYLLPFVPPTCTCTAFAV